VKTAKGILIALWALHQKDHKRTITVRIHAIYPSVIRKLIVHFATFVASGRSYSSFKRSRERDEDDEDDGDGPTDRFGRMRRPNPRFRENSPEDE
jgi:hypothetical protein